jgi:hypothetical protein
MADEECFLCDSTGKCKLFRFYSGIMKGGTTHRLLTVTVTFFERWSEMIKHEIHVCKDCQVRLWRKHHFPGMTLYALGAGLSALLGLTVLVLLAGADYFVIPIVAFLAALALGVCFVLKWTTYKDPKPKASLVEPLIIKEAMDNLPGEGHTFLTSEQYLERYRAGVIG